jgi:DNA-directed RNA polymerase subunit L
MVDYMKASLIKNENNELILEFDSKDLTIPELIAGRLINNENVKFASAVLEHPDVEKSRLVLKTEKKKAIDVLGKSLAELEEDLSDLKAQLSKK